MAMDKSASIMKFGFVAMVSMAAFACEAGVLTVKFGTEMEVEIGGEVRKFAKNDTFVPTAIPCIYRMRPVLAEGERTFAIYGNDSIKGNERNCRFPLLGEGNWVRVALDPYPAEDRTVELDAIKATGVFHVDAENGNDGWDGSADFENRDEDKGIGPKKSLQAANDAATGDFPIVLAAPGTYDTGCATNGAENARCIRRLATYRNIGFIATAGAERTFIVGAPDPAANGSGTDAISGVYMHSLNSFPVFIQGFTITGCYSPCSAANENDVQRGTAFSSSGNIAYCLDCVISNNYARLYPATNYGIIQRTRIFENEAYRKITNYGVFSACVFAGNRITNGDNTENTRAYQDGNFGCFCTYDLRNAREPNGRKRLDSSSSELHSCFVYGLTDPATYNEGRWNDSLYSDAPQFADADGRDYRIGVRSLAQNASSYASGLDGTARSLMTGDVDGRMPVLHDGMMRLGAVWNEPDVWYVSQTGGNDDNDGKTPDGAKATIKAATDIAFSGDRILVAPGTYGESEGVQPATGKIGARVVVPEDVTIESTGGAENTFIVGAAATGDQIDNEIYGTGTNAVRCVYAEKGAVVRGFTLTGGYTAGIGAESTVECHGAAFLSSETLGASLENCIVSNNVTFAGTIYGAVVRHCRVFGNFGVSDKGSGAAGSYCGWYGTIIDGNRGNGTVRESFVLDGCTVGATNFDLDGAVGQTMFWYTSEDRSIVNTAILGGKYYFAGKPSGKLYCTNCYVLAGDNGINRIIDESEYPQQMHNTIVGKSGAAAQVDAEYRPLPGAVSLIDSGDAAFATESVGDTDMYGVPRILNGRIDIGALEYDWRPAFSAELGKRFTVTHASPSVVTNAAGGLVISGGSVAGTVREKGPYKVQIDLTGGTAKIFAGDELVGECSGAGSHAVRFPVDDPALPVRIVSVSGEGDPAFAVLKSLAYAKGFVLGIR